MFATSDFDFSQAENGLLMAGNAFMRAIFLIFIFPRIIGRGRQWFDSLEERAAQKANGHDQPSAAQNGQVKRRRSSAVADFVAPETPRAYDAPMGTLGAEEPVILGSGEAIEERNANEDESGDKEEDAAFAFDLFFLRWSLILDGALTAGAAFATQRWHVYLGEFFNT